MKITYTGRRYTNNKLAHVYLKEDGDELWFGKGLIKGAIIGAVYEAQAAGERTWKVISRDVVEWADAEKSSAWTTADRAAAVLAARYRDSRKFPQEVEDAILTLRDYCDKLRDYDERAGFMWLIASEVSRSYGSAQTIQT